MKYSVDFHVHSHYSRATSKNLVPEHLNYWAKLKGVDVIGSGDCVHPGWLSELKEKMEPAGNGLYRLKKEYQIKDNELSSRLRARDTFFMLTGEISSIYKKNGRVRKIHSVCVFPDFVVTEKFQGKLAKIGNIQSDGRPILGLDARDLLEMVLESSEQSYLIPAHIWTPWFALLGSKSGFDSVRECFDDLTDAVFAVETGLSSDPPMNRACSFLDSFRLVSNSDAHSPEKLGREANLFDTELSYQAIFDSLKTGDGFSGTIEFFPQEGKYHYDGHRKCNICWDPLETIQHNGVCPVCLKPVTKGVMYRVAELADRSDDPPPNIRKDFYSVTGLCDLLAEISGKGNTSKQVQSDYFQLLGKLGSELFILLFCDIPSIQKAGGDLLAEGIRRLRNAQVYIDEGFDGEFGRITVFEKDELKSFADGTLFALSTIAEQSPGKGVSQTSHKGSIEFNIAEFQNAYRSQSPVTNSSDDHNNCEQTQGQINGIEHKEGVCMILAGPGAGKTRVLTERIVHLISDQSVSPDAILAITFSNKAAEEMRHRVSVKIQSESVPIMTFHAFGLSILKKYLAVFKKDEHFCIIDDEEKEEIITLVPAVEKRAVNKIKKQIEQYKQGINSDESIIPVLQAYENLLQARNAFDLDDLIYLPVLLFRQYPDILSSYREQYRWILVDEYQDINARQYELIRLLAGDENPNLFVIGDPNQAIYGFRGSDVRFIEQLKNDYPELTLLRLEKSFRCPDRVLKAAGQVVRQKTGSEGNPDDIKIEITEYETGRSEADGIAGQIEKMIGGVRSFSIDSGISDGTEYSGISSFSDFAVLCRTSAQFDSFITAFKNHGIAYQVVGLEPFYKREPLNSMLHALKSMYYQADQTKYSTDFLSLEVKTAINDMMTRRSKLSQILEYCMDRIDVTQDDRKRILELNALYDDDYSSFFRALTTRQGTDDYDSRSQGVSLMTIHAAKGLEFNAVFIPGCEQGILPFELFGPRTEDEMKEEERLFYVAVTRTKKYLFVTYARTRQLKERFIQQPKSSFIDRIEQDFLNFGRRQPRSYAPSMQLSLFDTLETE